MLKKINEIIDIFQNFSESIVDVNSQVANDFFFERRLRRNENILRIESHSYEKAQKK